MPRMRVVHTRASRACSSTATSTPLAPAPPDGLGRLMTSVGEDATGAGGSRAELGRFGEELAARFLRDCGMEVVERNWRCEHGEVDIVARDGDWLVICEVKTRRGTAFGDPVEGVTLAKALRLRRLAVAYLGERGGHRGQVRIDVVGVLCPRGGTPEVRHIRGLGS